MNPTSLYVNVIGVICFVGVGAWSVHSMFEDHSAPPCSTTYPQGVQFPFETGGGAPLSPIELQARAGADERNVIENAKVVGPAGAPARSVLEVRLAGADTEGGIESGWTTPSLQPARSACLAYSVWLPDGFAYSEVGMLPGLYGGRKLRLSEQPEKGAGFTTRVLWHEQGASEMLVQFPGGPDGVGVVVQANNAVLRMGRWTRLEQEVVLNDPGQSNGQLRMWLDGHLVAESTDIAFRTDAATGFGGVAGDVGYARSKVAGSAADAFLRLSPFEVSWK